MQNLKRYFKENIHKRLLENRLQDNEILERKTNGKIINLTKNLIGKKNQHSNITRISIVTNKEINNVNGLVNFGAMSFDIRNYDLQNTDINIKYGIRLYALNNNFQGETYLRFRSNNNRISGTYWTFIGTAGIEKISEIPLKQFKDVDYLELMINKTGSVSSKVVVEYSYLEIFNTIKAGE